MLTAIISSQRIFAVSDTGRFGVTEMDSIRHHTLFHCAAIY